MMKGIMDLKQIGPYKLYNKIGQGATSIVRIAQIDGDSNVYAIKIIPKKSIAIDKDNIEVIKMLLECPNIDLNVKLATKDSEDKICVENSILRLAVIKGNKDVICLLLHDKRTDYNAILTNPYI